MISCMVLTAPSGCSMENRWLEGILAESRVKAGETSWLLRSTRSYQLIMVITASHQHRLFIDGQLYAER